MAHGPRREPHSEERFARDLVDLVPRDAANANAKTGDGAPAFTFAELKAIRARHLERDAERSAAAWPEARRCATIYPAPLANPRRRAEVQRIEETPTGVRVIVA